MTRIAVLIVAAGRGTRASAHGSTPGEPKQYVPINGVAMLAHTIRPFLTHPAVDLIKVVVHAEDRDRYAQAISTLGATAKLLAFATGGDDRQASVHNGLEDLASERPDLVLIHDAARPFITQTIISDVIAAAETAPAAILATELTDTLKRCASNRSITETIPRAGLWRAETPQAFRYDQITAIHRKAAQEGMRSFTDDAGMAEWAGIPVKVVESGGENLKVTTARDIAMADQRLAPRTPSLPDIRTGQGFDVHKFKPGDHVWLCGVRIPHEMSVEAHSDGDVGLHALTDALLGAIADGDIGVHFRNDDPRWSNASSDQFVLDARRRVQAAGGTVMNVDVTLLCEAPRVSKFREQMRARMSELLGIDPARVSVKATTTETLGFTGRREGLAAMATATVVFR